MQGVHSLERILMIIVAEGSERSKSMSEYIVTIGDLLQAFMCSMCKYSEIDVCPYLPESSSECCKQYERQEQEHDE